MTKTKEQRAFEIKIRNSITILTKNYHDDFEKFATELYEKVIKYEYKPSSQN